MNIETDKLYKRSVEPNTIPPDAFAEVFKYLEGIDAPFLSAIRDWRWTDPDSEWNLWNITSKASPFQGKWPKRFANYVYKKKAIKVSEKVIAQMGEIISRYTQKETRNYYFEFAKYSDWKEGAFAERDGKSCWWGDREGDASRLGLVKDPRGYALLFYSSPTTYKANSKVRGIGRCWVIDQGEYLVIFNAYGHALSEMASLLAQELSCSFMKSKVYSYGTKMNTGNKNNISDTGKVQPYEIEGMCYLVGKEEVLKALPVPVDIGDIRLRDTKCSKCGELHVKATLHKHNAKLYCDECEAKLTRCFSCEEYGNNDEYVDVHYPGIGKDKVRMCPICVQRRTSVCTVHGVVYGNVDKIWHTSKKYCETCRIEDNKYIVCQNCDHATERFAHIKLKKVNMNLCIPCHKIVAKVKYEAK